jgi:hypothetical protein
MRKLTLSDLDYVPELVAILAPYDRRVDPDVTVQTEGGVEEVISLLVKVGTIEVEFLQDRDTNGYNEYTVRTGYYDTQDLIGLGIDSEIIRKSYDWLKRVLEDE